MQTARFDIRSRAESCNVSMIEEECHIEGLSIAVSINLFVSPEHEDLSGPGIAVS